MLRYCLADLTAFFWGRVRPDASSIATTRSLLDGASPGPLLPEPSTPHEASRRVAATTPPRIARSSFIVLLPPLARPLAIYSESVDIQTSADCGARPLPLGGGAGDIHGRDRHQSHESNLRFPPIADVEGIEGSAPRFRVGTHSRALAGDQGTMPHSSHLDLAATLFAGLPPPLPSPSFLASAERVAA